MAQHPLKAELLREAHALGFDLCRIAPCVAPPHAPEFLQWLEEGRHGDMAWLERNKARRTDPQQVLPGARSVIVLAVNYWNGEVPQRAGHGRIAHYAWGDDYHLVLEKKLAHLDAWLAARGGQQRYYVDTGPVLERDFAALAGAGWHGKSTMLIHPRLGTWFFLAELLTTLDLEADSAQPDRCGRCTRCVDACPTGAITAPHHLDARLCVSYLTIELKTSIPLELRPLLGDRIYGCDACLEACPWNRFAQVSRDAAFQARPFVSEMSLRDFLAMDEVAFRAVFAKSPIKRIKRRGFLRNVCVALGNVGTEADLPALEAASRDPEPLIVEHALWAIAEIQKRRATTSPLPIKTPLAPAPCTE